MKFSEKAHNEGWTDNNTEDIEEMLSQMIEDINDDCYNTFDEFLADSYRWYIKEFTADELETLKKAFDDRMIEKAIEAEEAESYSDYEGPDAMDIAHELIEARYLGWIA